MSYIIIRPRQEPYLALPVMDRLNGPWALAVLAIEGLVIYPLSARVLAPREDLDHVEDELRSTVR